MTPEARLALPAALGQAVEPLGLLQIPQDFIAPNDTTTVLPTHVATLLFVQEKPHPCQNDKMP